MPRNSWTVALLAVLAGWGSGASGQDSDPSGTFGSVSIDVMEIQSSLSSRTAFFTNGQASAFANDRLRTPRLSANIQFNDRWGLSGSLFTFTNATQTLGVVNTSPNVSIQSVEPFPGFVVRSPDTFRFLGQLPRVTLFDNSPRVLPPFPFRNSLDASFPDTLSFQSSSRMSTGHMGLTGAFVFGGARSMVGMGLQHATFRQNYSASRVNAGGTRFIPGYDPFVSIDDDSDTIVFEDNSALTYTSAYTGTGPRASLDVEVSVGRWLKLFGGVRGGVLFGERQESATLVAQQRARVIDQDQRPPAQLNFTTPLNLQTNQRTGVSVPTGEVELGVSLRLGEGIVAPFIRISGFSQYFINVGNITDPGANVTLHGVSASLGMDF